VTCADDIAVAIPLAFWAAIASGAKRGIIIKGASYLEGLAKCKMLIVDKTGTLTKGKIKVKHVVSFGITDENLIQLMAMAESVSDHPMARAIIEYANTLKIKYIAPEKFNEFPGKGMKVEHLGKNIIVGNLNFFKFEKVVISDKQLGQINQAEKRV
jgi:P-type E1-E2 ATPase